MQKEKTRRFSEDFSRSRNRVIYFSAFGLFSIYFPIHPQSTLFGLRFDGLTSENLTLLFFVVALVLLIFDCLPKMVEEAPVLSGKQFFVDDRLTALHDEVEELTTGIQNFFSDFPEAKKKLSESFDFEAKEWEKKYLHCQNG